MTRIFQVETVYLSKGIRLFQKWKCCSNTKLVVCTKTRVLTWKFVDP